MTTQKAGPRPLPPLLPTPLEARPRSGAFALADTSPIVLQPDASPDDYESARALRDGIAERCGRQLAIEGHARTDGLGRRIELRIDASAVRASREAIREQGYRVDVESDCLTIVGGGSPGLRYGVETVLQLVQASGRIPACSIHDVPSLALRGIMLDVSRGKVPKPETVEALIDLCVALKLNVFMLYTEHTFHFRRHPEIGAGDSPLDAETMRRLDAYAAARFVDLVPCLQSLGHMEHILKLPAYSHLSESDMGWSIAPVDPRTQALIRDLYDEYLPNFRSRLFNANCDEPWDMGRGRSAERSEELGAGGLYLEHVSRLKSLAKEHGKRTMIWGDVVHGHPERIPEIDRELILLDWWYEAPLDYDRVKAFVDNGLEFMVCPGTSTWNSLFPRVENSMLNISRWADAGRRHGALGLLNTDWGDFGHYNLQGNSFFAYAWGAQESWSGPCEARQFDRAFSRELFGDGSGEVARLYRALGAVHDVGLSIPNSSSLQFLFFDDIERSEFVRHANRGKLERAGKKLAKVKERIEKAIERAGKQTLALEEMLYAADASLHAVAKTLAGLDYNAWRTQPTEWKAAERRKLARRLEALAIEQTELCGRLRGLWMARSLPSNFAANRRRLMASVRGLRKAASALEKDSPRTPPPSEPVTMGGAVRHLRKAWRP